VRAILLTRDLMCSSQVSGAAARAGLEMKTASTAAVCLESAAADSPGIVILDLNTSGFEPGDLVGQLRALPEPPRAIIAFGPHVHEARLAAATAAGCDAVLSRGQFYAQAAEILGRWV
jgi:DNA-binding response OmpR family regulator